MYELTVESHFDAAHSIEGYRGECARVHGHTWRVALTVRAESVDELGMSIDFKRLRGVLDEAVRRFDHRVLNELEEFAGTNPTAENIARVLYGILAERLCGDDVSVLSLTISEGEGNVLTYRP